MGERRHSWVRSGRTTEEVEATYCSSVAGSEGRSAMICGCKKRNRRKGNVAEKNAAINLFNVRKTNINYDRHFYWISWRLHKRCSMTLRKEKQKANHFNITLNREHYFLIIAWLRVDYLSYNIPTYH